MKRILSLAALMAMALGAQADNYNYLTVTLTDGSQQSIDVSNGLTITFADGNLVAKSGSATTTLALSGLSSMQFTEESTGVESISSDIDANARVLLYDTAGKCLGAYVMGELQQQNLRKGVYIVKGNNIARKVIIK